MLRTNCCAVLTMCRFQTSWSKVLDLGMLKFENAEWCVCACPPINWISSFTWHAPQELLELWLPCENPQCSRAIRRLPWASSLTLDLASAGAATPESSACAPEGSQAWVPAGRACAKAGSQFTATTGSCSHLRGSRAGEAGRQANLPPGVLQVMCVPCGPVHCLCKRLRPPEPTCAGEAGRWNGLAHLSRMCHLG